MCRILLATALLVPVPAPNYEKSSIPKLIEELGATNFDMREAAVANLLKHGVEALPEIRKALAHPDVEVRRRAQGLVSNLERSAALEPKRVSLRLTRRPIRDAVAEIAKQTGYALQIQPDGNRDRLLYDFHFDKLTFWEAMGRIMEAAQLTLHPDENHGFQLMYAGHSSPFVHHTGVTRLTAQGFQYQRGIDLAQMARQGGEGQARSESLTFSFSVSTEPKIPLLGLGEVKLTSAYDDQNRSMLLPVQLDDHPVHGLWNGMIRQFFAPQVEVDFGVTDGTSKTHILMTQTGLVRPSANSQKLKSIKGTVMATLLADQRPDIVIEEPLKAKGKKFTSGKMTLDIGDTGGDQNDNRSYRIKITISEEGEEGSKDGHHQFHWVNSMPEHFELVDDKGKKYATQHAGWEHVESNKAQLELLFTHRGREKLGKPAKLIYYKWVTMQHPIEFEFKDLPLP